MKNNLTTRRLWHEPEWTQALGDMTGSHRSNEEIVDFMLGEQGYSVPARFVREIRSLGTYTVLPALPPFILGQIDVRGQRLPLLDLRPLLDITNMPPDKGSAVLIVSDNGLKVGLLAGTIMAVRRPDNSTVLHDIVPAHDVSWVRGIDPQRNLWLDPSLLLEALSPAILGLSS